jgi:hypothetical protein
MIDDLSPFSADKRVKSLWVSGLSRHLLSGEAVPVLQSVKCTSQGVNGAPLLASELDMLTRGASTRYGPWDEGYGRCQGLELAPFPTRKRDVTVARDRYLSRVRDIRMTRLSACCPSPPCPPSSPPERLLEKRRIKLLQTLQYSLGSRNSKKKCPGTP